MPRKPKNPDADEATSPAPVKKTRVRRAKYITLYSHFLMKDTKHELIGEPVITESGRHQWARCTRSHHSQLINLDQIESEVDKSKAVISFTKEDARRYSPIENYNIGDVIFHKVWDDIGIVQRKDTTTNGGNAIIVQFEKNLEKRLIENFQNL
ncbi:MAG: hypothetical protein LBO69_09075 [Ignavibacteria bacterium]|jgi:hypothetical protein|nr:hypothetical protein [Ignavibacteria bacterium]